MTREEAMAAMKALQNLSCKYSSSGACDCMHNKLKPQHFLVNNTTKECYAIFDVSASSKDPNLS